MTTQLSVNIPNDVKDPVLRRVITRLIEEGAINKDSIAQVVSNLNTFVKNTNVNLDKIREDFPSLATEETPGIVELSDTVETDAGLDKNKVITPYQLKRKLVDKASILRWSYRGEWVLNNDYILGETVTLDGSWFICIQANTATNSNKPDPTVLYHTIWRVVAAKGDKGEPGTGTGTGTIPDATTTIKGKIEIATSAEATTGTDILRAMTPKLVKDRIDAAIATISSGQTLTTEEIQDIVGGMFSGIATYNDLQGTINFSLPSSSASLKGLIEIATNAETDGGSDNVRAITPYQLKRRIDSITFPDASMTVKGNIEIASSREAVAGTDTIRAMTPKLVKDRIDAAIAVPDASTTVKGKIEIATGSEATTGTDTLRAMTPKLVKDRIDAAIAVPDASTTVKGKIEIATSAEAGIGTDSVRAMTPKLVKDRIDAAVSGLSSGTALTTEQVQDIVGAMFSGFATYNDNTGKISIAIPSSTAFVNGLITLATSSEAIDGTDNQLAMTPKLVKDRIDAAISGIKPTTVSDASTTVKGKIEIATGSEATTGTDTSRAMTPKLVKDRIDAAISAISSGTALTTEQVQDIVGAMFSGVAFYDDLNNKITITLPTATTTIKGITEIATTLEGLSGVNRTKLMTPYLVKQVTDSLLTNFPYASTTVFGILELANNAEADAGRDTVRAMTPYLVKRRIDAFPSASVTQQGKIEIATNPEALLGTDDARAMTPKKTKYVLDEAIKGIQFPNVLKEQVQDYTGEMFSGIATYDDVNNKIDIVIPSSSATEKGLIELATGLEATQGTDSLRAITPSILKQVLDNYTFPTLTNEQVQDIVGAMFSGVASYDDTNNSITITLPNASTAAKGVIEIATSAEADTGTSNLRAITPFLLKRRIDAAIAALPADKILTTEEVQDIVGGMFSGIASYNDSQGTINFSLPSSSASLKGLIEIATNAETDGGSDNVRAITPYQLKRRIDAAIAALPADKILTTEQVQDIVGGMFSGFASYNDTTGKIVITLPNASQSLRGLIQLASNTEGLAGSDVVKAMSPRMVKNAIDAAVSGISVPDATTIVKGKIQIATNSETDGGSNNSKAITPFLLKRREDSIINLLTLARGRGVDGFPGNFGLSDDYITVNQYTTSNLSVSQWRVYEPQNTLVGFSEKALEAADRVEIRIENNSKGNYFRNKILAGKFLVIADQTNTDNRFVDFEIINYRSLNQLGIGSYFWIDVKYRESGTDNKNWDATKGNSYLEIVTPKSLREVIADQLVDSSTAVKGLIEIATDSESITATDNTRAITPFTLKRRIDAAVSGLPTTTIPDASTAVKGKIEIATSSEAGIGTDNVRAMTPKLVKDRIDAFPLASISQQGKIEIASSAEATTGTDTSKAMTPKLVKDRIDAAVSSLPTVTIPDASKTVKGKIEIATSAEAKTGTDILRAMTPKLVKDRIDAAVSGLSSGTALTTEQVQDIVGGMFSGVASYNDNAGTISITLPKASTTVQGNIEIATGSEATTGTDTLRAMTPKLVKDRIDAAVSSLSSGTALTKEQVQDIVGGMFSGIASYNDGAGTIVITLPNATTTSKGVMELSSTAKVDAGSDNTTAITPWQLNRKLKDLSSILRNVYRGVWTLNNVYKVGETVSLDGSWFICIQANTATNSNKPDPTVLYHTIWRVIAAKGDKGEPGTGTGTGTTPDASTTVKGKIEIATGSEASTGTDTLRAMTPKLVKDRIDAAVSGLTTGTGTTPDASTTVKGKIEIATGSEATTGTDTLRAMTPKLVKERIDAAVSGLTTGTGTTPDASTTVKGKIEIATSAESFAGTATDKAMTPKLVADQIIEWNKYKAKLIQLVEPADPGVDGFPGNQGFLNTRSSDGSSAINKRKGCALVQRISSSSNLSGYGWSLQNNSGHYVTTMTESGLKNVTRVDINLTNGRINHVAYPAFYLSNDEEMLKIIAGFTKSYNFYDDLENGYFRTKNYINYKFLTPTVSVGDFITFADVQNYNNRFVDFKITGFKQVTSANDLLEGVDFWLDVEYKESGSDLSNWKPRTKQYKVGASIQSSNYTDYTLYANLMWIGSVSTAKTIWGKRNELLKLV